MAEEEWLAMEMYSKSSKKTRVEEGFRGKMYQCTADKLTIGYGLNLESGITEEEARVILEMRLGKIERYLARKYSFYNNMNEARQTVIDDMVYQLGPEGFSKFKKTIDLLYADNYIDASKEMLDSKWAKSDSPSRARRNSDVIRTGLAR